eukprot:TRINITY_DN18489_c0_g1_i1.p3 TRINITY_DN18489_c0_g1~~TRINITY_DN18489_c0_g1_i1.p3  ORF type:complete len:212 (+),score=78.47 TRINITY_DN18489_c0_g1_i1:55-690(+)
MAVDPIAGAVAAAAAAHGSSSLGQVLPGTSFDGAVLRMQVSDAAANDMLRSQELLAHRLAARAFAMRASGSGIDGAISGSARELFDAVSAALRVGPGRAEAVLRAECRPGRAGVAGAAPQPEDDGSEPEEPHPPRLNGVHPPTPSRDELVRLRDVYPKLITGLEARLQEYADGPKDAAESAQHSKRRLHIESLISERRRALERVRALLQSN